MTVASRTRRLRWGAVVTAAGVVGALLTFTVPAAAHSAVSGSIVALESDGEPDSAPLLPLEATVPTVTGVAAVGRTLTAVVTGWTPGATLTYQWLAGDTPIADATSEALTLTAAEEGTSVSVQVTGELDGYTPETRESAPTAAVAKGKLATATPKIAGVVAVGSTLTAKPGAWTAGTAFTYQWYANGKKISGAKNAKYKVTSSRLGARISVKVAGKLPGYTSVAKTSAASAKAPKVATPKISGSAKIGSKLTAKPGTWTAKTTLKYRWYADGKAISKATKSTYTVPRSMAGKAITVKVTGKKSGYTTVSKVSKATPRVLKVATPKISGSPTVTRTLKVAPGPWTAGTTFSYQWYANGKAISKATKSSLKVTSKVAGKRITVKVTGRQAGYTAASKTSAATAKVKYPSRTTPASSRNCPSWAPIKGNADSGIYHLKGQRYYDRTKPEECFRTEAAAKAAGYRKAKV